MLISIVTLNYKKPDLTISCVTSLWEQYESEFRANIMEVIIVDNDSQDDSVSRIREEIKKKKFVNMHVIANPVNSGFGVGCNTGAKTAKGKYIIFLNNDTVVKDGGLVKMAQYCEEHEDVAILGGQLRNFDGSLQASTGKFYTPYYATLLMIGGQRIGLLDKSPSEIKKVEWVKGGLLLIRKDAFEKLKGFDEKIFMYTEDMELCYRAHQMGMGVYFYPDVRVLHKDQGSSNKTFAIVNIYKNLLYFYKKHRSPGEYLYLRSLLKTKAVTMIEIGHMFGIKYLIETYEKAKGVV
jgi:GT2 family glycosyltransferase